MTRRLLAVVVAAGALLALAGCTPSISVTPAPAATDTGCAALIVRLPETIGAFGKRETDSQGTAAWGDPEAVQLRCGVTPPGPTTDPCYTASGVDWILANTGSGSNAREVITTFGRTPATQVVVDPKKASVNDVLPTISDAVVAAIPTVTRHCTTASQATASPAP
ncbi:DUF3515 domain-containing protein [Amnibacterium sp.]|uniref:DUF3515 domain-containing protein n=1 Tax=Amnibacterium sp. TaxID=1872496 RepID=UPI002606BC89|nr:DUF3515 domain-containing protein [Amnibacterium sp.]MCU1475254.1 hypothetical protein [Amnibacterium sp.]